MTRTHTPGPWVCEYTSYHAHDYRLFKPDGTPLPVNAPANDRSEQRANARLIAAAPELLEALKACQEMIEKALPRFNWGASALPAEAIRLLNETPGKVAAAIAKAETV